MADTERFDYKKVVQDIEITIATLRPPKTILLVDDDEDDIELTIRLLNKFHTKVTACSSGQDARAMLAQHKYDLILFDLVMPGLDGLEFILGTAGLQPGAHFILVTGYPLSPKVDAILRLGAVMLSKPLTEASLEMLLPRKTNEPESP
jgi:CheY-like chemotaxis protein